MARRWQLEFEEEFWDALIQLPGWPASLYAVLTLLRELSHGADQGEPVAQTKVRIAKTVAVLPDDSLVVRLVLYYALLDEQPDVATVLWVDDADHLTEPPHLDRLPPKKPSRYH